MDDSQRCTATAKSTGERCKRAAIEGGNVCSMHGGKAPQVQQKAQERLDAMADSVTKKLQDRLDDVFARLDAADTDDEYVKLLREARQLTTAILDRTDHGPSETHELEGSDGGPIEYEVNYSVVESDAEDA